MERQTVLIVDDSELNRMMLMEILGEQYHYIEAQNGREAVRLTPVLRRVAPSFATGDRPHRHRPPPEISAENFRQNPMDKLTLGRFFVTIIAQKTNVSVHGR